jgi:hypothetical protein
MRMEEAMMRMILSRKRSQLTHQVNEMIRRVPDSTEKGFLRHLLVHCQQEELFQRLIPQQMDRVTQFLN